LTAALGVDALRIVLAFVLRSSKLTRYGTEPAKVVQ